MSEMEQRVRDDAVTRAVAPVLAARDAAIAAGIGKLSDYYVMCSGDPVVPYSWSVHRKNLASIFTPLQSRLYPTAINHKEAPL